MADVPDIRASDVDRERVAETLRRHCGEGRLTLDELGDRLGEAYAARTVGDLSGPHGPLRDLPLPDRPPPVSTATPPVPVRDRRALRQARRAGSLNQHLSSFVIVNLMLVVVWALTGFGYFWPIWVILVWGAALARHYVSARGPTRPGG